MVAHDQHLLEITSWSSISRTKVNFGLQWVKITYKGVSQILFHRHWLPNILLEEKRVPAILDSYKSSLLVLHAALCALWWPAVRKSVYLSLQIHNSPNLYDDRIVFLTWNLLKLVPWKHSPGVNRLLLNLQLKRWEKHSSLISSNNNGTTELLFSSQKVSATEKWRYMLKFQLIQCWG